MKVYISGGITGVKDYERRFSEAEERLAERSDVEFCVNPVRTGRLLEETLGREPEWSEYMRADLAALLGCDAIYMLDGWEKSGGAKMEHSVASQLGFTVMTEPLRGQGKDVSE